MNWLCITTRRGGGGSHLFSLPTFRAPSETVVLHCLNSIVLHLIYVVSCVELN